MSQKSWQLLLKLAMLSWAMWWSLPVVSGSGHVPMVGHARFELRQLQHVGCLSRKCQLEVFSKHITSCEIRAGSRLACFAYSRPGQCDAPADLGPVLAVSVSFVLGFLHDLDVGKSSSHPFCIPAQKAIRPHIVCNLRYLQTLRSMQCGHHRALTAQIHSVGLEVAKICNARRISTVDASY